MDDNEGGEDADASDIVEELATGNLRAAGEATASRSNKYSTAQTANDAYRTAESQQQQVQD
eukprot:3933150-Rhodomonas_salina.1